VSAEFVKAVLHLIDFRKTRVKGGEFGEDSGLELDCTIRLKQLMRLFKKELIERYLILKIPFYVIL